MDGSSGRPCASGSTVAAPLLTVATSELVVPRSMPTASRCSWGAGDVPGSEICRSATVLAEFQRLLLFHRLVREVDFGVELVEEHQLAHQPSGAAIVFSCVDAFA